MAITTPSEEEKPPGWLGASGGITTTIASSDDALPASPPAATNTKSRGTGFWIIMAALMLAFVISALDGAVVSTACQPSCTTSASARATCGWSNIYFLTTAAVQPFLGQLSDLWGRRWVFISTVACSSWAAVWFLSG
ncbi:hypothetical protein NUW58_g6954 [Xylaria curta]|uniref:Uncharacterized protein n=1 Tax=Xylaria curta TaxID=42375 RepID=A0ACC1NNB2_9PEZI|nr:hypothetical protein NUW58_g6954 [Xylaria curta]